MLLDWIFVEELCARRRGLRRTITPILGTTSRTLAMTKHILQNVDIVGDGLILLVASAAATNAIDGSGASHWPALCGMAMVAMFVWTLGARVLHHYNVWNGRGIAEDVALTIVLFTVTLAAMGALRWAVAPFACGTDFERFSFVAVPAILWLRSTTIWLRRRERPKENVLVLGSGPLGRHTGLEIRERRGRSVFGYLRFTDEVVHDRLPAEVLGVVSDLENIVRKHVVSEVYLASNHDSHRAEMQAAIGVLERFGIPFALPACGFRFGRARPEHERATAEGYVHYLYVRSKPVQQALKRAFDILASSLALALFSPLIVVVAVVIKVTSRGPLLFRQERVTLRGRSFHILKFRSMVAQAEQLRAELADFDDQGPLFKMPRDPRITAVGRFIRKYNIDELPQLVNVLRGEMSLVGPCPPTPSEVAKYEAWQRRRLSVRPGLTCVWRVGGRSEISFEEWMCVAMRYVDRWSLAQDFQLILQNVPAVFTGRGAS